MSVVSETLDRSHSYYNAHFADVGISREKQREVLNKAWTCQERIVAAMVDLMYPIQRMLNDDVRRILEQRSVLQGVRTRPNNRNTVMNKNQQYQWILRVREAVFAHKANDVEKVKTAQATLRDYLLNDCDYDVYLRLRQGHCEPINCEWLPQREVRKRLAIIDKEMNAFHHLEQEMLPQFYALARKNAKDTQFMGDSLGIEDAQQEAIFGCIRAFRKFHPGHGHAFTTVASLWMFGALRRFQNKSHVIHRDSLFHTLGKRVRAVLRNLDRTMSEAIQDDRLQSAIARELDMPIHQIQAFFRAQEPTVSTSEAEGGRSIQDSCVLSLWNAQTSHPMATIDGVEDATKSVMEKQLSPVERWVMAVTLGVGMEAAAIGLLQHDFKANMERIRQKPVVPNGPRRKNFKVRVFKDVVEVGNE